MELDSLFIIIIKYDKDDPQSTIYVIYLSAALQSPHEKSHTKWNT